MINLSPFLLPKHPFDARTKMLSLVPAVLNLTFIFKPLLPLSITAPVGIVQTYDVAPVTAVAVYVVPIFFPTIEQILVRPESVVGAASIAFIVAVTGVLDEEIHPVRLFLAVA